MAKKNFVHTYHIVFEQIHDPGVDILDVRRIAMDIYASTVEDAQIKAWNILSLDKDKYEIILIEAVNRPYYRQSRCVNEEF